MAEHGDGGGGGSGAGFFLALFAAVAIAWFFAQMQKQDRVVVEEEPTVIDSVLDETVEPEVRRVPTRTEVPPQGEHGVTYYLDEDGNILGVEYF